MASLDLGTLLVKIRANGSDTVKEALNSVANAGKACAKAIAVGAAASAAAIGAISTQAIKAYGDYEQLTGGVETLFKDSADTVKSYANKAYVSSGLSANDYMETITSFSASLLQSLGNDTAKAAEYGNQAAEAFNQLNAEIDELKRQKNGLYSGFDTLNDYVSMLNNKSAYDQFIATHATKYRASGMTDDGIRDIARRVSGYDGVTVYQNFYTKTATPSEVYNATKKAANDMEVTAQL